MNQDLANAYNALIAEDDQRYEDRLDQERRRYELTMNPPPPDVKADPKRFRQFVRNLAYLKGRPWLLAGEDFPLKDPPEEASQNVVYFLSADGPVVLTGWETPPPAEPVLPAGPRRYFDGD